MRDNQRFTTRIFDLYPLFFPTVPEESWPSKLHHCLADPPLMTLLLVPRIYSKTVDKEKKNI